MSQPLTLAGKADGSDVMRPIRLASVAILLLLVLVLMITPHVMAISTMQPTPKMLFTQDLPLLPIVALGCLMFSGHGAVGRAAAPSTGMVALAALALFALCLWGHWGIFWGIDLTRDEQLANFDAAIFRHGRLFQPVPPLWQPIGPALNQLFLLPVGNDVAWVSSYLPVNAALRAAVGTIADPALTSPLLVVVALVALVAVTRRLWPDSPGSQMTAVLCFIGSSQVVITGMTAFSMTAHLALNLLWLYLFLRRDRRGMAGALIVGFLATGLHQPLFHPLFALPFLIDLMRQRRWSACGAYGIGYAVICAFWVFWPSWISRLAGPPPVTPGTGIDYISRLSYLLGLIGPGGLWTTAANLVRFLAWQHLLVLPLAVLGVAGWRRWPLVRPLAAGMLLPVIVMAILLPWQGHGWGYRYLHPVLGNLCLLAGFGWRQAELSGVNLRRPMLLASLASILVVLPVHCWMARTLVATQAIPDRQIQRLPADIAVIDAAPYSFNLAVNAPDLSNQPIRLIGAMLKPADFQHLCPNRRVAFIDAPRFSDLSRYYGTDVATQATPHQNALRDAARQAGCVIVPG